MSLRGSMYSVSSVAPASSAVTNTDRVSSLLMKRPMERKLRKTYFKLEDACQKYQPIVHETEYWPRIDLDTPHGYCPFICSSEEHKERLQLYEDLQREQTRQNHHVKKTPKGAGTGCNAGEKVRIRRNITYCECCRMHISNLDEHLQSQEHQSYVTNEDNYREVKEMMNDLNKSADSLLQQYFLKQQKIKRKPAANTVNSVTHCSTYKENIPLQQNEERQSYSCTFVKQAETAECNEYKSSLASCSTFDTGHENSPSQIQQSESFGKASKLECSVGKENVVKDVNGKCTFSGRSTSENIEHGFMRSLAVVESTFATASVIYKCSDVEIEAEMRDEKQRRFSHVEKLRTKTCCNAQRNSYLSAEISQQKDLNCQKTKSVNCSCSALSSLQNSFYESRNCDSNILKEMKFAKQQKLRTPPFKKVCAKLFKSPAPYEFSLENFGIKLTPSPNIAYNKNPVQSIGQPVSDESYKYLEPSPEIIEQSLKLKVSERTAEIVSSSSIVQSDFAKAIKDAIFVDINSVSDKLKVVEIHDESAGTRRCANTVTPPRSKRAFADMVFVSSVDDACENYRKKSSPTVQVKRLRLEDIERTVVDDDVTFFTPRSSMKGAQFTHEHSSNSNKVGSSCEKRTNTAPGTDFNSKCTTPCLFTGVSSPVTILGRSFDCVDAEMEMVDEQSDEMPPSPVIGSKSRRDQSVASTATTGTGTIATGGYELIQIGDSVGESTHVEQQQQQLSSYVEGFYPLATETAAELEDEHRMEIVMDTRANAHLACTQDYIRKHKSTGRKKGGADCNNSEFVVRRTGRKRTARGESSCSQTDEEESTTTNGNATTIAERISTGASARCRSNTPKYLYRTPPREVHVVPTTPTPNLDSLLVPNSAQRSTSTLKETLKMKRVRKICRKLNSGAQNADVKHFELLIRKGSRIVTAAADVRAPEEVKAAVDECVFKLGLPSIVINNAAGNFISPTERLSSNAFRSVIDIVLMGTINVTMDIGRRLIHAQQPANFLAITTTYAHYGSGYVVPSACAKSGVQTLHRSLASEWGKYGLRFNCIAPGPIYTQGAFSRLDPTGSFAESGKKRIPTKRFGELGEISNLACYLVSDYSSWLTGEVVNFDGGEFPSLTGEFNSLEKVSSEQWDQLTAMIKASSNKSKL